MSDRMEEIVKTFWCASGQRPHMDAGPALAAVFKQHVEPMIAEAALVHLQSAAADLPDVRKPQVADAYAARIIAQLLTPTPPQHEGEGK